MTQTPASHAERLSGHVTTKLQFLSRKSAAAKSSRIGYCPAAPGDIRELADCRCDINCQARCQLYWASPSQRNGCVPGSCAGGSPGAGPSSGAPCCARRHGTRAVRLIRMMAAISGMVHLQSPSFRMPSEVAGVLAVVLVATVVDVVSCRDIVVASNVAVGEVMVANVVVGGSSVVVVLVGTMVVVSVALWWSSLSAAGTGAQAP